MMRYLFILVLPILFPFRFWSQETSDSLPSLTGKVQLAEENTPLSDELVYLYYAHDSSLAKTTFTNELGAFTFHSLKKTTYFVCIKSLQYGKSCTETIALHITTALSPIVVSQIKSELNEFTLAVDKPFVERSPGKMTVNVDQTINATGSSAFEVIEKSPGVSVSITDQISVNGKQGIIVQINGKPIQMSGSDLANYLRGLPSSSIEKIEFITNPSSKYDANGGIIIDIRLKKDARFGTNGTLTNSYGQGVYPKFNTALNLNHRQGKWNLFFNYSYNYRKNFNRLLLEREFYQNDTLQLAYHQNNYLTFPINTNSFRTGFDYEIDSLSTLSLVVSGVSTLLNPNGINYSNVLNGARQKVSIFETFNDTHDNWKSGGVNLNYLKNTDTLGSTFSMDADYALYDNSTEQLFTTNYYDLLGQTLQNPYILFGDLKGNLSLYSLKADRNRVFKASKSLEYGIKSSYVKADNSVLFFDRSQPIEVYDSSKSNHFIYTENINAAYGSFSYAKDKWSYQAGLRIENTNITGNQLTYNQQFDTSYVQIFPTLSLQYKLNEKHTFDVNLNRRIDRPSYRQLNPFKFYLDPTTYEAGNPYLRPQTSITAEVGHTYKGKLYTLVGIARTFDNITEIIGPSPLSVNTTVQTNVNLDHVDLIYANLSLPLKVTKWWNMRVDLSSYLALYSGTAANTEISQMGSYNANVQMTNQFTIAKKHTLELTGNYRTREVYAFDIINQIGFVSLGYQTKILKSKGTLRLNATDLFFSNKVEADVAFTDYVEHFIVTRETRVCTLAFTYKFGSAQPGQRRRGGGADDIKQRVGNM